MRNTYMEKNIGPCKVVTIWMPTTMRDRVKTEAQAQGRSFSNMVKTILQDWMDKER